MIKNNRDNQKDRERKAELGIKILENCRNELYRYFPYLDGAFASLEICPVEYTCEDKKQKNIFTDGERIYFDPDFLLEKYVENPAKVKRGYLHILLHCLYLHLLPAGTGTDRRLWNLACDLFVEQIIEQEMVKNHITVLRIVQTDAERRLDAECRLDADCLTENHTIRDRCLHMSEANFCAAKQIYQMLSQQQFPYSVEEMERAFGFDDHRNWESCCVGEHAVRFRKKWERIVSYTTQNKQNGQNRRGNQAGNDEETLEQLKAGRYDYRRFLKKFAIPREEVELDTESFDYIFYHYGLEHYGNLPLIEPLEYKEVNRIEELVIAIDTSGSCSKEMVQQFLDETYRIFSEKENFFRKMKVHILQCDCSLQDVAVIHSEEEWKEYSKNITIQGRTGTNFRPVFRYVEEQRKKKEIKNLKALIYFTDGDGVFPEKTDYETAFVFVKKCECMDLIPAWITKLLIYQQ